MTQHRKAAAAKSKKLSRLSIFGPAPILEGEDSAAYDELLTQITTALKPRDIIDDILIRDAVDSTWEIFRWRRLKASFLSRRALTSENYATMENTYDRAFLDNLDDIERIDRLVLIARAQRNSAVREIDRRGAAFAQSRRRTAKEIEDAEFETIAPKKIAKNQ